MVKLGMFVGWGNVRPDSPLGLMASAAKTSAVPVPSVVTIDRTRGERASGLTIPTSTTAPTPAATARPSVNDTQ